MFGVNQTFGDLDVESLRTCFCLVKTPQPFSNRKWWCTKTNLREFLRAPETQITKGWSLGEPRKLYEKTLPKMGWDSATCVGPWFRWIFLAPDFFHQIWGRFRVEWFLSSEKFENMSIQLQLYIYISLENWLLFSLREQHFGWEKLKKFETCCAAVIFLPWMEQNVWCQIHWCLARRKSWAWGLNISQVSGIILRFGWGRWDHHPTTCCSPTGCTTRLWRGAGHGRSIMWWIQPPNRLRFCPLRRLQMFFFTSIPSMEKENHLQTYLGSGIC